MSNNQRQAVGAAEELPGGELPARVNDEFVSLESVAVFKCRSNGNLFATSGGQASQTSGSQPALAASSSSAASGSQLDSFSHLLEWFTSDGLRIGAGETGKAGNKFTAFRSGELHVNNVEPADLRRTYGCRLLNELTRRSLSSSGLAQLIVTDSLEGQRSSKQPLQTVHSVSQIIVEELAGRKSPDQADSSPPGEGEEFQELPVGEWKLLVPCAVRGLAGSPGELRWFYQPPMSKHLKPISIEQMAANLNLPLLELTGSGSNDTTGSRNGRLLLASKQTRILIGPSYLAIEWPRRQQSGRYLCQLVGPDGNARTMCDTNVIVRQPLKLKVEWNNQQQQQLDQNWHQLDYSSSLALAGGQGEETGGWLRRAVDWFGIQQPARRRKRSPTGTSPLEGVQVRSRGLIPAPPILLVGQRLQLSCLASGYPVDSVKWFRNGQLINTQSSSDFQIEITNSLYQLPSTADGRPPTTIEPTPSDGELISSLTIRQLQPKNAGLQMFECMGQNAAGDRARAGLPVFVAERQLVELARASCPLTNSSMSNSEEFSEADESDLATGSRRDFQQRATFLRNNPFQRALLLESDPFELVCPIGNQRGLSARVDWRRLTIAQNDQEAKEPGARNFNQLFMGGGAGAGSGGSLGSAGDARFVINGSSLQIRSPSKRHDEAVYLCRQLPATGSEQPEAQQTSFAPQPQATKPASGRELQIDTDRPAVHQSSLAASTPAAALPAHSGSPQAACNALLLAAAISNALGRPAASSEPPEAAGMSSISIRIVAKPKIDPFEFSKNLEEGMRAVVVCSVVSGQSPIDITWFKDGNLLLEDEQTSLDQVNGFSSTLTFHQIRPSHSGYYTCIAANAFASTNHTSRLLVNEAAYFIEPPKNTQAILNSNVLINCRAGGQPSPQIRWRKLVAVNGNGGLLPAAGARQLSPAGGGLNKELANYPASDAEAGQQMASAGGHRKFEFRIITSNSHIQILENGSMIIKEVELADASRYVCQAFNGINPSLSEMIELQVLSPAQFDVHFETVSVKRDSMIKFSCAPKGDQPMRIEWLKEGHLLAPAEEPTSGGGQSQAQKQLQQQSKYTELAYYVAGNSSEANQLRQRHSNLQLRPLPAASSKQQANYSAGELDWSSMGVKSSELFINYADRADTGLFVCVARNAYGKDELSYRLVVQEAPDVPQNINAANVLSSSLKLTWTAPFDGNLPISHFVIEHRRLAQAAGSGQLQVSQPPAEWVRLVVPSNKLASSLDQIDSPPTSLLGTSGAQQNQASRQLYSIVLRQLIPKSAYHIRVAAVNGIGQSGFSSHLTISTAEELPNSRPNDLRAQPLSSSSIKILWRGPAVVDEQAPIKGYYVSHRRLSDFAPATSGSKQTNEHLAWLSTSSVSASNSSDFQPEVADASSELTNQGPRMRQLAGRAPINSLGGLNYELTLNNLERNTKYEIRVQPYNSMGVGPASETFGQTLKFDRPSQPQLKLVGARKQSLELKWFLPSSNEQPLMGFSLFYKCEFDDWQEIQLGIIYQYVIENLRCGNKYQIYLSAFNLVGRSDPSDVLSARTEGTVPIAPDKSQFYQVNMSEIILDLSSWQSGGCPINSFIIQYKRLHDSNWYMLSEGASSFAGSEKVPIGNLTPASWYKLLVTASNEAGPTNAEYVFSTLDLNGEQIAPTFSMAEHEHHRSVISRTNSVLSGLHQLLSVSPNQQADKQSLLISFSCLLLLAATIVASYFYYSRATSGRSGAGSGSSQSSLSSQKNNNYDSKTPPSNLMNRMQQQGCSETLKSHQHHQYQLGLEESQQLLIQQQQQHLNNCPSSDHQVLVDHYVHHQPQSTMLDSFISSAFANGQRNSGQTNLKPLLTGSVFGGAGQQSGSSAASNSNCTNSSLSTHSTQCLDGSSCSQASSSQTGAKAKLQLIDEASILSGSGAASGSDQTSAINLEDNKQHFQLYDQRLGGQFGGCAGADDSPNRQSSLIYAGIRHQNHVNVLNNNDNSAESNFSVGNLFQAPDGSAATLRQLYPSCSQPTNRLLTSSSFASAADLLHRQQAELYYNQEPSHQEEPTYQRLDKFQLPAYGMQQFKLAQANQLKSQTLRFHPNHSNATPSLDHARTMQRFQTNTQQEFTPQHHQLTGFFTSGQQAYNEDNPEQCQLAEHQPEMHPGGCLEGNCA